MDGVVGLWGLERLPNREGALGLFHSEVERVFEYVRRGLGVRVVGPSGSGRTTIAKQIVSRLEEQGTRVYSIFAVPQLQTVPFAGVLSLGLDLRSRPVGVMGVSDVLSAQLSRPGPRIILIDDIESLDRESLSVIDIAQSNTSTPLVVTARDEPIHEGTAHAVAAMGRWQQATVALPALQFDGVGALVAEMLGAPAEIDVVARVLRKSGGVLRLAVRLIETAVLSDRLIKRDGRWVMNSSTLMNEHLNGTLEALLNGLAPEDLRALETIAILGPTVFSRLTESIGDDILDKLERRGLISVVPGPDDELWTTVYPPIIEDFLRIKAGRSRKILSRTIGATSAQPVTNGLLGDAVGSALDAAISELRNESAGDHAVTARLFHRRIKALEKMQYEVWYFDRTLENAVKYLKTYWGSRKDHRRLAELFSNTELTSGRVDDRLFFSIAHALWEVNETGLVSAGAKVMANLSESMPNLALEARALTLFLRATFDHVPDDAEEMLNGLTAKGGANDLIALITAMIELYRLNPDGAIRALNTATPFTRYAQAEPFIRGLAMFTSGSVDEAVVYSLRRRRQALDSLDPFSLVAHSYVASIALLFRGLFEEAEYLMGATFALGRPGFVVRPLYDAMLRLSSLRDLGKAKLFCPVRGSQARDIGAILGAGDGLGRLIRRDHIAAETFDAAASALIAKQAEHGYRFDAAYTALIALSMVPGPNLLFRLRSLVQEQNIALHDQLLAIAAAVLEADVPKTEQLLARYVPDGDAYVVAMLLNGAIRRHKVTGSTFVAAALERAAKSYFTLFPVSGGFAAPELEGRITTLTPREREIALLTVERSNQEIAELLGLSVRTVETHISNALKKTNTPTRKQLAQIAREEQDYTASDSTPLGTALDSGLSGVGAG